jgi:4-amino-4-deoxy-L-arabinose transferase-like glycosyltransferase
VTTSAGLANHRFPSIDVPGLVLLVAGLMVAGLLAVAGAYGFHGDEMYFVVAGQHPAFGYVDQPPLTPMLSAASVALLRVSPTAVRVLPALEMGLIVVLVALIARDLGGSRRAQVLAAIVTAVSGYLGAGHLDTTTEPDLLTWAIILWLLVRLLDRGDRRLWLAVGVTAGFGLENKDTLLFLGAGLAVGLVATRRWDVVRSP